MIKKEMLIFLVGLCTITALVFWRDVAAWITAMTPGEAVDFIMTFALKAVVLAILSWLMYHAPEFIRPWLKLRRQTFRQKQKMTRRGLGMQSTAPRAPRLNKDQALLWMANQLQRQTSTGTPKPTSAGNEPPTIRFE